MGIGIISVFIAAVTLVTTNSMASGKNALCSGSFPNGSYSGSFEVTTNSDLSYYTEYLEVDGGEIRIYPTFNSQTKELSFDIEDDGIEVSCNF